MVSLAMGPRECYGELHAQIGLQGVMDEHIFELAMIGYLNLKRDQLFPNDTLLTIVDYRAPWEVRLSPGSTTRDRALRARSL